MTEADWKAFRAMVPALRERYLRTRNETLVALLSASDKTESERFWDAEEAIRQEKKVLRDCLDGHSRSQAFFVMMLMRRHGMLLDEDLASFSEELRDKLREFDQTH